VWRENWPTRSEWIIGLDDASGELVMLAADIRGVRRIYTVQVTQTDLRIWRDAPGFNQRFNGQIAADGSTIVGRWERSEDGPTSETDFDQIYTKMPIRG
jgi:hypothetical protein